MERLLAPHQRPLFALCLGMLRHPEDAEDAVQETFYRALQALSRFRRDAQLKTWLTRIAINVCLERQRRSRPVESLDAEPIEIADSGASPETLAVDRVYLAEALGRLRPRQRATLILKEVDGWKVSEIAEATGWSQPRVKVELYRTRRALARWLNDRHEAEEKRGNR